MPDGQLVRPSRPWSTVLLGNASHRVGLQLQSQQLELAQTHKMGYCKAPDYVHGVCITYPPLAEFPGLILGVALEAVANRIQTAGTIFWDALSRSLGDFTGKLYGHAASWISSAPIWTPHVNGTVTVCQDPYPISKTVCYMPLATVSYNFLGQMLGTVAG